MPKESVTVRMDAADREAVDRLAALLDRDRSWVINDAVRAYREFHEREIREIEKAVAEADAGDIATDEEVEAFWRRNDPA